MTVYIIYIYMHDKMVSATPGARYSNRTCSSKGKYLYLPSVPVLVQQ